MNEKNKKCLYCQGETEVKTNGVNNNTCKHCGMALPIKHPQNKRSKISFFTKVFWLIAIFCVFMIIYLPR